MTLVNRIFSHDLPRSKPLAVLLLLIVLALAVAPWLFPGAKALGVASKLLVFILLVASYDLLLGYTGIVSFAHTLFFGVGAYGVAISSTAFGPGWAAVAMGLVAALLVSLVVSLVIGLFSLRVKAIFFAMITLAVAAAFQTLASQLSEFTGGEDGLSFKNPELLSPSFQLVEQALWGVALDGKLLTYYLNDFRAEALGYQTVVYRTLSNVLSALFATLAGVLLALALRYTGPDTTLSFEIMLDILLMVVIGGMGTMYGAIVGAALFMLAQNYLQDLLAWGGGAFEGVPVLGALLAPERWLLWLGVLFVLSVYHFPTGVVGRLRSAFKA
jgi:branched-chain amino acid transport system permease protein